MPDIAIWPIIYTRDLRYAKRLAQIGWKILAMEGSITVMGNPLYQRRSKTTYHPQTIFGPSEMWPIRYSLDEALSLQLLAEGWIEVANKDGLSVFCNPAMLGGVAQPSDRN